MEIGHRKSATLKNKVDINITLSCIALVYSVLYVYSDTKNLFL